jgi:pimeloyl-ACP methyl ester carboxylesterase
MIVTFAVPPIHVRRWPMLAWCGRASFGDHCFNFAKAIADSADGGIIEECGHWVFEEKIDFIRQQLSIVWEKHR